VDGSTEEVVAEEAGDGRGEGVGLAPEGAIGRDRLGSGGAPAAPAASAPVDLGSSPAIARLGRGRRRPVGTGGRVVGPEGEVRARRVRKKRGGSQKERLLGLFLGVPDAAGEGGATEQGGQTEAQANRVKGRG